MLESKKSLKAWRLESLNTLGMKGWEIIKFDRILKSFQLFGFLGSKHLCFLAF